LLKVIFLIMLNKFLNELDIVQLKLSPSETF
jgi:hypothetical protein